MSEFVIDTHALRKEFGRTVAVKGLTLQVPRGEIFGFLGPNGAGKSTSIKMLLGLVHPTSGDGTLLGAPIGDVATRRRIGFLPEDFSFYEWLTARELVALHARLAGMPSDRVNRRVDEVLELVGLAPHRDRRVRTFSKGMHQRVGLAQALVHEPDVIFLDEPTSGLDPIGRRLVRDILRAQRERGATVFLNSHLLGEIEITCDRVVFIKDGEVVATQDLAAHPQADTRVRIRAERVPADAQAALGRLAVSVDRDGDDFVVALGARERLPLVVRELVTSGADVYEVVPQREPLEELFVRIMGEDRGL
ncbi:MAG TPA: ABC transporter ATP-binding protein [Gemmatimonadaceae bacterium]|nr:ABC transporter ATP-binding protein [Gemmatimonadaceae bacterium]